MKTKALALAFPALFVGVSITILWSLMIESDQAAARSTEPTPVIRELKMLTTISDVSTGIAAIRALQEFAQVRNSRLSRDADQVLKDLKEQADQWAQDFIEKDLPSSITFEKVFVERSKMRMLHLLNPKLLAFINVSSLDDIDIRALDQLGSVENLTIQDCEHFFGHGFKDIVLPNVEILHLNGSSVNKDGLRAITEESFPRLKYVNIRNTDLSELEVEEFRKQITENGIRKIQIAFK